MPDISEIVDVTITVQSAALSRKGFNSLIIVGSGSDFDSGFGEHEVREYTTAAQLGADADVLPGNATDMATVAFAQSPSVSSVYLSKIVVDQVQTGTLTFDAPIVGGVHTTVNLNAAPQGGGVPFNTDNVQTLLDIAAYIQAFPEVTTAVSDGLSNITITTPLAEDFSTTSEIAYALTPTGDTNGSLLGTGSTLTLTGDGTALDLVPLVSSNGYLKVVDGNAHVWEFDFVNANTVSPVQYTWDTCTNILRNGAPQGNFGLWSAIVSQPVAGLSLELIGADGAFLAGPLSDTPITTADLNAIADNNNDWFGLTSVFTSDADIQTLSSWGTANKKYGFFRTVVVGNTLNLNSDYSSVWYTDAGLTGTAAPLEVAIASRILAEVPGSYTSAFKTLQLVSTTQLSATDEATLRSVRGNQYTDVSGRSITWDGVTTGSGYIDIYIGVLYLEARIAEDVFAYMASVDKVPFTNAGVDSIVGKVQARLDQSVVEEFLSDDPAPLAEAPRVADISATDKSNRLLPNVTFTATASGAVHMVQINGTVIA